MRARRPILRTQRTAGAASAALLLLDCALGLAGCRGEDAGAAASGSGERLTPLAIGMGAGTEIMRPLALAVVGGLLVAMLMTLFVVPSLYLVVSQLSEWLKAFLTGSERDPERVLEA